MNPLGPSSLNAERARAETARATSSHAAGLAGLSGGAGGADGAGFAQMLMGAREAAAPPAAAPEPARAEAPRVEQPKADRSDADEDRTDDDAAKTSSADSSPTLAHWLLNGGNGGAAQDPAALAAAGANVPPPQQPAQATDDLKAAAMARQVLEAVRQRARTGGGASKGAEAASGTADDPAARRDAARLAAKGDPFNAAPSPVSEAMAEMRDRPTASKAEGRFADALQQAQGTTPLPVEGRVPADNTAVPMAPTAPTPTGTAHIDTPVHDAGFGHAVGVTISRLAKEGVHEAHLQLNPAELGPMSVRIEMNGQEARLSLGAAHADTRALLDASLPALTEAFRADGLVLAASQVGEMSQDRGAFSGQAGQGGAQQGSSQGGAQGGMTDGGGQRGTSDGERRGGTTHLTMALPAVAGTSRPIGTGPGAANGGLDLYA